MFFQANEQNELNLKHNLDLGSNSYFENYWERLSEEFSCSYISESDFVEKMSNSRDFLALNLNIQSIRAKFTELTNFFDLLQSKNVSISLFSLQELWRNDIDQFTIPGYRTFSKIRSKGQGGGVGFYLNEKFDAKIIDNLSVFHEGIFESLAIEIQLQQKKKAVFVSLYRPNTSIVGHSTSEQKNLFLSYFEQLLLKLKKYDSNFYIFTDANLNLFNTGREEFVDQYLNLTESSGAMHFISKATHFYSNSASAIDHIISNDLIGISCTGVIEETFSDHCITFAKIVNLPHKTVNNFTERRYFTDENVAAFKNALSNLTWAEVMNSTDPNIAAQNFSELFKDLYDIYFPLKRARINRNKFPINAFMTKGLLISRKTKMKLDKKAKVSPSPDNINRSKTYRNIYNTLIKKAKRIHFSARINNANGDSSATWKVINEVVGKKKKKPGIDKIEVNGSLIEKEDLIANEFNTYFTKIAENIKKDIPNSDLNFKDFLPPPQQRTFFLNPTTRPEVIEIVRNLKSKFSTDINDVNVPLLKEIIDTIALPLSHIFNLSMENGVFPTVFKVTKTTPLFKAGNSLDMSNYRGISIIDVFSKIFEKLLCQRILSFLLATNFFSDTQFGFLPNRDTNQAIIHLVNQISLAINEGDLVLGLFIDVKKAFDTVDHKILFEKLKNAGFRGIPLQLLEDYFKDRKQRVKIGNSLSTDYCNITDGVLQGSILGVIFFLIYINDLELASPNFKTILFADDGNFLLRAKTIEDLLNNVNIEIQKIVNWYNANKLSIHPDKTKMILFRHRFIQDIPSYLPIFMNLNKANESNITLIKPIKQVPNKDENFVRVLGFKVDENLNFLEHFNSLRSKLNSANYALRVSSDFLGSKELLKIYYSNFYSHCAYSSYIISMLNKSQINQLLSIQRKAVRIVFGKSQRENIDHLFIENHIMKLDQLISLNISRFMFKLQKNLLSPCFTNDWLRNSDVRDRNLRNDLDFCVPFPNKVYLKSHPFINFASVWNSLPRGIKNSLSLKGFCKNIKLSFNFAL